MRFQNGDEKHDDANHGDVNFNDQADEVIDVPEPSQSVPMRKADEASKEEAADRHLSIFGRHVVPNTL